MNRTSVAALLFLFTLLITAGLQRLFEPSQKDGSVDMGAGARGGVGLAGEG